MPLHENFREYTEKEINEIKKNVCAANKCPYLGSMWNNQGKHKALDYGHRCCNYFLWTHKLRDCMPDECTHYRDENVQRKRFFEVPVESKRNYIYI